MIGYSSNGSSTELPADRFEDYLRQYGLDGIVTERARRGEKAKPGRERFYRYAKALLTGTAKSATATRPLGFAYEIVPGDDPTVVTGPLRGRILYGGKPLGRRFGGGSVARRSIDTAVDPQRRHRAASSLRCRVPASG